MTQKPDYAVADYVLHKLTADRQTGRNLIQANESHWQALRWRRDESTVLR